MIYNRKECDCLFLNKNILEYYCMNECNCLCHKENNVINHLYDLLFIKEPVKNNFSKENNVIVEEHFFKGRLFYECYNKKEGRIFLCGKKNCYKKYTTKNGIIYHLSYGCIKSNEYFIFQCDINNCKKQFRSKNGLYSHKKNKH